MIEDFATIIILGFVLAVSITFGVAIVWPFLKEIWELWKL